MKPAFPITLILILLAAWSAYRAGWLNVAYITWGYDTLTIVLLSNMATWILRGELDNSIVSGK